MDQWYDTVSPAGDKARQKRLRDDNCLQSVAEALRKRQAATSGVPSSDAPGHERHFVSGQPLSFALRNAWSPGTTASCL